MPVAAMAAARMASATPMAILFGGGGGGGGAAGENHDRMNDMINLCQAAVERAAGRGLSKR